MKKLTKILVLVLSVALLLCAFALLASAETTDPTLVAIVYDKDGNELKRVNTSAEDTSDARAVELLGGLFWAGGEPGTKIVLQRDINDFTGIQWGANANGLILDLGGHTLTSTSVAADRNNSLFYLLRAQYTNDITIGGTKYNKNTDTATGIHVTIQNGTINAGNAKIYSANTNWNFSINKFKGSAAAEAKADASGMTYKNLTINSTAAPTSGGDSIIHYFFCGKLEFDSCKVNLTGTGKGGTYYIKLMPWYTSTKVVVKNSEFNVPNSSSAPSDYPYIADENASAVLFANDGASSTLTDGTTPIKAYYDFDNSTFKVAGSLFTPWANARIDFKADNCFISVGHDTPKSCGSVITQWHSNLEGTYDFTDCKILYTFRFISVNTIASGKTIALNLKGCDVGVNHKMMYQQSSFLVRVMNAPVTADANCRFSFNPSDRETPNSANVPFEVEEGTRFTTNYGLGITMPEGCSLVFDPAGDAEYPYVVSSTAGDGASNAFFDGFQGQSLISFQPADVTVDGDTVTVNSDFVMPSWAVNSKETTGDIVSKPAALKVADIKHGLIETKMVADNAYFKYSVLAPSNNEAAETVNYGTLDASFTLGAANGAGLYASYEVFVLDFAVMADSDKGFTDTNLYVSSGADAGDISAAAGLRIYNDGKVGVFGSAISTGLTVTLDANDWNTVSAVVDVKANTIYWIVNGENIATNSIASDVALADATAYCEGIRFEPVLNTDLTVGSSLALDNFYSRAYVSSETEFMPVLNVNLAENEDITVNGIPFKSINDAIVYANKIGSVVELHADIDDRETILVDGTVITNGFKLPFTAESNAAVVTMDGDTVAQYVFDSSKNDIVLSEVVWTDNVLDSSQETVIPFKLGHTFEYYLPTETATHKIDIVWGADIAEYFGEVLTEDLIDDINGLGAAEPDSYTITDKVNYKTNVSFTSDFNVNLYVPYFATMNLVGGDAGEDVYTAADEPVVIGNTYYMQLTVGRNLLSVADGILATFDYQVGNTVVTDTIEISITDYVDAILSNEGVSDADALLMYYMLKYVDAGFTYAESEMPAELAALLATATEKYEASTSADKNNWGALAEANQYNTLAGAGIFEEAYIDLSDAAPKFVFKVLDSFEGNITITYNADPTKILYTHDVELNSGTEIVLDLDLPNFTAILNVNGALYNFASYANAPEAAAAADLLNAFWAFVKYSALYVA